MERHMHIAYVLKRKASTYLHIKLFGFDLVLSNFNLLSLICSCLQECSHNASAVNCIRNQRNTEHNSHKYMTIVHFGI